MKPHGPYVKCSSQNILNTDNRIVSQIFILLQNAHKCDLKKEKYKYLKERHKIDTICRRHSCLPKKLQRVS